MSFADDLKKWRGGRCQKQVNDFFGVPLGTYRSWEQSGREPNELTMKQIRLIMAADEAGVPVHLYVQNYWRVIKQVAAEIQARK